MDKRRVFVIHEGGDAPRYALCDRCVEATNDPAATRRDATRRDDALHCIGCDWHFPECPPECPAWVGFDEYSQALEKS